jgi:hypothetical protein
MDAHDVGGAVVGLKRFEELQVPGPERIDEQIVGERDLPLIQRQAGGLGAALDFRAASGE